MKKLIVIGGPTASGKTDLSCRIAQTLQTEIISADSRQVYKELNTGTAKPSPAVLATVRHHFISLLPISEDYNAGRYETDALDTVKKLFRMYDTLVVTGGSGLYISALLYGLDDLPASDPVFRSALNAEFREKGIEALQKRIVAVDPEFAKTADLNNPQRLIRALEVTRSAGRPYSQLKTAVPRTRDFIYDFYCIEMERDVLYNRINERVEDMFSHDLVGEVRSLLPYRDKNALQTVGYKEIFEYLDGKLTLQQAVELVKKNTRNYAKRQITWFRKIKEIKWLAAEDIYRAATSV